ncbi:probable beta-1,4-xylosyltransferase IRX14 [Zingiber officinale]|uniref:probable beta-1,4-xylosyltransferase IRX14 n=1 Tax=Zingiber officinale TaxID=94328 RepID=UPI001C4C9580|nr:probable beta-1,4-xylosyltransferase IRX14 [Zingiber officinale]
MKQLPEVQLPNRRTYSPAAAFRPSTADEGAAAAVEGFKHPAILFSPVLHLFCCLLCAAAGFRVSRLVVFLSPAPPSSSTLPQLFVPTVVLPPPPAVAATSRVVAGRHGIRVRPWPHPDPVEVARANEILSRVQEEQRVQCGVKDPRPVLVVTPTYARTFQALHLTALAHSLMLVRFPITWIVVEAGGVSHETAALLAPSRLRVIHLPFHEKMPVIWGDRHRFEARMRLHALRVIRERRLEGLVVFADESNVHSTELFEEIQKVEWMGAMSVEILSHLPATENQDSPSLVEGPACNSSGQLIGWHTIVDNEVAEVPERLEWAGFVINSRLLWKEGDGKPDWVRDLDDMEGGGTEMVSPFYLLKDASLVQPLGNCGKKVLLWWIRAEAHYDSKFPAGWMIGPPLEVVAPAKQTPWPGTPPALPLQQTLIDEGSAEKHVSKKGRSSSRSKRSSRNKKKQMRLETSF